MPTTTKKLAYYYKDGQYYEVTTAVDAELSATSENPIQNKAVAAAINSLQSSVDSIDTKADAVTINGTEYTASFNSTTGVLSFD